MTVQFAVYNSHLAQPSSIISNRDVVGAEIGVHLQNPLPATLVTQAAIPEQVHLELVQEGIVNQSSQTIWQAQNIAVGIASINLGPDYRLIVNEFNASLTIDNINQGTSTHIWGDPYPAYGDNENGLRFWGDMTFVLKDATRITVQTIASPDQSNSYVLDRIVVTRDNKALIIRGAGNHLYGDLDIRTNLRGQLKDLATPDGYIVMENEASGGWLSNITGKEVSQDDLQQTAPGQKYGPGEKQYSLNDFNKLFRRFLNSSMAGFGYSLVTNADVRHEQNCPDHSHRFLEILAAEDHSRLAALQNDADQLTG